MKGTQFRVSPLKLRVYLACPLRYRYQYIDRLQPRLRPQDTVGSAVHYVLQQFFRLPPQERTPARLLEMFDQRWDSLSPRYRRMPGVEELRERARRQLEAFAARADLAAQPLLLEPYLEVALAPDVVLCGRPDRLDEEPDGSLHVIDYKTGEPPEEVDEGQLRLYAIMVEKGLGRPVRRASFWYLEGGQVWTAVVTPEALVQAEAEALALARALRWAEHFPANVGPHCARCPFLYACQYREEIARRRQVEGW